MATGFTETVRQELAHAPLPKPELARQELEGIFRFCGVLTRHGGESGAVGLQIMSTSGATARRTYRLVQNVYGYRPELFVQRPQGLSRHTLYGVRFNDASVPIGQSVGLLNDSGWIQPLDKPRASAATAHSFLRGVVLASATFTSPSRDPHVEIAATSETNATYIADLLTRHLGCRALTPKGRIRVVIKSGECVGELLKLLGATNAFVQFEEQRIRRQLRADANRLANADNANVKRSVAASLEHTTMLRILVSQYGLDSIPEALRQTALVRLANPHVSLRELGQLLDPPVGKAAVHRRLHALRQVFEAHENE